MVAPWGRLGGGVSNLSSQVPATPPQAWPTLNKHGSTLYGTCRFADTSQQTLRLRSSF